MNKKVTNSLKPKKKIFLGQIKNSKRMGFKNPITSQRVRSLGGHR